jgi:NurA-like 5'-3' nuclease
MKSLGLTVNNNIVMTDESDRVIGVGSDLTDVYQSMPVIEKLRSETMTKALQNKLLMTKSLQSKPLESNMQKKLDELDYLLKSMATKTKKSRHCWV